MDSLTTQSQKAKASILMHYKKNISAIFLVLGWCLTSAWCAQTPTSITLYVSPQGNDAHDGSKPELALATLEKARDLVRDIKKEQPISVILLPGLWTLKNTLAFGPEDSGTTHAPINYRSAQPRTARLMGAERFKLSDFKPISDANILERLDPLARKNVVALPVSKLSHIGPFPGVFDDSGNIFELFMAGQRLPLSRWPNGSEVTTMGNVIKNGGLKKDKLNESGGGIFEYNDARIDRWVHNPYIWLKGQWRVGWQDPAIKVEKLDPITRTITFAEGIQNGIAWKYNSPDPKTGVRPGNHKEPWFAINLLEEIDVPGEWALDFETQTVYLWPPVDEPNTEILISQLGTPLIEAHNTKFLNFSGFTLEASLGHGIVLENVSDCSVTDMNINNLSKGGILAHGTNITLQSNDIHHLGEGAIYISGGDRKNLIPSQNKVINNHLHHYGILRNQYSAGIHVGIEADPGNKASRDAVGIHIAHNSIHHAPRDAFLYSGNDNVYEYNEVYYCGYNTRDTGAFYSWLDWTMRGNIIRYNYIHDIIGGVNPDDGASGNHVYGNIFKGDSTGIWIASGPDNTFEHNIFIKSKGSVFGMDARGATRGYATNKRLIQRLQEIQPEQEPWASHYPEIKGMLNNRPDLPWRSKFIGNLIVNPAFEDYKINLKPEWKNDPNIILIKDNMVIGEDPGFVDMNAGDYTLKPDAEVFDKIPEFKAIPFKKMGLKVDEFRKILPSIEESAKRPEDSPYKKDDGHFGT
jgi:hypothetical protein